MGFPIRKSPDQRLFTASRSLSQCTTSFIASYRLGIHQTPFSRLIRASESRTVLPQCGKRAKRERPPVVPGSPAHFPPACHAMRITRQSEQGEGSHVCCQTCRRRGRQCPKAMSAALAKPKLVSQCIRLGKTVFCCMRRIPKEFAPRGD